MRKQDVSNQDDTGRENRPFDSFEARGSLCFALEPAAERGLTAMVMFGSDPLGRAFLAAGNVGAA
jgi:hypothetical protein